jgi:hypothetical protein
MKAGSTGIPSRQLARHGHEIATAVSLSDSRGRANTLAAWLALIGLIIPAGEVQVFIGSAKFTTGRLGITLLLVPAVIRMFGRGRKFLVSDFFVCATAAWMIVAGATEGDSASISSSIAEAIEICGGYLVARAYFFGPAAMRTFLRVLKILTFAAILLAMADTVSGRLIVHETIASVLHVAPTQGAGERAGLVRAASTFDHPILLGVFCSLVGIIELYSERNAMRRVLFAGFCFFGSALSFSSAGIIACFLGVGLYSYDRLLNGFSWRWRAFWGSFSLIALAFFLASNAPLGWIVTHLTFDAETGYYRFMIWDAAIPTILESPFIGFGFRLLESHPILTATVDSVWLVLALRFGLPMVILLILANATAIRPVGLPLTGCVDEIFVSGLRTGFTIILAMFMFLGLTVHYWNYLWIFWGICIGIRASLYEYTGPQDR